MNFSQAHKQSGKKSVSINPRFYREKRSGSDWAATRLQLTPLVMNAFFS